MKTKLLLLGLAALLVSGCAPTVTAMGPDSLTLKYDPSFTSLETAQAKAETLCREHYGKTARHLLSEPKSKLFIQHATFACEEQTASN